MQDGSAAHTAHTTPNLLLAHRVDACHAKSLDLDSIERIWDVIGRVVRRRGPANVRQLQKFVMHGWNGIDSAQLCLRYSDARWLPVRHPSEWQSYQIVSPMIFVVMIEIRNLINVLYI